VLYIVHTIELDFLFQILPNVKLREQELLVSIDQLIHVMETLFVIYAVQLIHGSVVFPQHHQNQQGLLIPHLHQQNQKHLHQLQVQAQKEHVPVQLILVHAGSVLQQPHPVVFLNNLFHPIILLCLCQCQYLPLLVPSNFIDV